MVVAAERCSRARRVALRLALRDLQQVAAGVVERREDRGADVGRLLQKHDAEPLQSRNLGDDVVGRERRDRDPLRAQSCWYVSDVGSPLGSSTSSTDPGVVDDRTVSHRFPSPSGTSDASSNPSTRV